MPRPSGTPDDNSISGPYCNTYHFAVPVTPMVIMVMVTTPNLVLLVTYPDRIMVIPVVVKMVMVIPVTLVVVPR